MDTSRGMDPELRFQQYWEKNEGGLREVTPESLDIYNHSRLAFLAAFDMAVQVVRDEKVVVRVANVNGQPFTLEDANRTRERMLESLGAPTIPPDKQP